MPVPLYGPEVWAMPTPIEAVVSFHTVMITHITAVLPVFPQRQWVTHIAVNSALPVFCVSFVFVKCFFFNEFEQKLYKL